MTLPIHKTVLKVQVGGDYPVALRDASAILVEEQPNLVPLYAPGMMMNALEAQSIRARELGEYEGKVAAENANKTIEAFKGVIRNMLVGMKEWGPEAYINGLLLSNDLDSPDPAVTKPENSNFSFQFRPKIVDLGLTGRLLEDDQGQRHQEKLALECSIYDAYDLATTMSPQRIVMVDKDGRERVVYAKDKPVGETEEVKGGPRKRYLLHPSKEKFGPKKEVLPTGGLKIVYSDLYKQLEKYDDKTMFIGHKFSDLREFLGYVCMVDEHLIWDVCRNNRTENTPLTDYERHYGRDKPLPHQINRIHLMENKAYLELDGIQVRFDRASGLQALMCLGDIVRDIWMEPVDREWDEGWDIVFDRSRGITPANKVAVITDEEMKRYAVKKE
jgi:hypothetical protein